MAAPTYHNMTISSGALIGTSGICNKPTLSDGDWMLAMVTHRAAEVQSPPDGTWTMIGSRYVNATAIELWVKYVPTAAAETATDYTWTWTTSVKWGLTIMSVSGAAPTNIYDAFVGIIASNNTVSPINCQRIFTRTTDGLSIHAYSTAGGNTSVSAFGGSYTATASFQTGTASGTDTRFGMAYKTITGAIPVAVNHTLGTSRGSQNIHVLMRTASTPMPFCIRSFHSSANNATATHNLLLPTIWAPGDLGLMPVGNKKAGIASVSSVTSGWSQVGSTAGKCNAGSTACCAQALFARILQSGDGPYVGATWDASGSCAAHTVAISLGSSSVAYTGAGDSTDNSTMEIPGVTVEASAEEFWDFASVMINRDTGFGGTGAGHERHIDVLRPGASTTSLDWKGNTAANPAATTLTASNTGASTALRFVVRAGGGTSLARSSVVISV